MGERFRKVNHSRTQHRKERFMSKPRCVVPRRENLRRMTYLRSGRHAAYRPDGT
ncbi:hypothetical protein [Pasteuria penetrans]|uniref:hypothetical protein n=1 Tax=Pasteuria penetrans TaxID=86005 RepID=UPI001CAA7973|nr:hypothetical protein [Pasteuria penetrans]